MAHGGSSPVTCASAQAVPVGIWGGQRDLERGQLMGQEVISIPASLAGVVRSWVTPTSSSEALRDPCTSGMAKEIPLPTLPLCSPITELIPCLPAWTLWCPLSPIQDSAMET